MLQHLMKKAMYWIEAVIAIILVVLTIMAIGAVGYQVYEIITHGFILEHDAFSSVMASILDVFILVELFAIALAYMQHKNIIPVVLEAALVAIARKMVIFEPKGEVMFYAFGLASLLLAVALTWFLLARAQALGEFYDGIASRLMGKHDKEDPDSIAPEL